LLTQFHLSFSQAVPSLIEALGIRVDWDKLDGNEVFQTCPTTSYAEAQWNTHLLAAFDFLGFTTINESRKKDNIVGPCSGTSITFQGSIGDVTVDMTTPEAKYVSLDELLAILAGKLSEVEAVSVDIVNDSKISWDLIARLNRLSSVGYGLVLSAAQKELKRWNDVACTRSQSSHRGGSVAQSGRLSVKAGFMRPPSDPKVNSVPLMVHVLTTPFVLDDAVKSAIKACLSRSPKGPDVFGNLSGAFHDHCNRFGLNLMAFAAEEDRDAARKEAISRADSTLALAISQAVSQADIAEAEAKAAEASATASDFKKTVLREAAEQAKVDARKRISEITRDHARLVDEKLIQINNRKRPREDQGVVGAVPVHQASNFTDPRAASSGAVSSKAATASSGTAAPVVSSLAPIVAVADAASATGSAAAARHVHVSHRVTFELKIGALTIPNVTQGILALVAARARAKSEYEVHVVVMNHVQAIVLAFGDATKPNTVVVRKVSNRIDDFFLPFIPRGEASTSCSSSSHSEHGAPGPEAELVRAEDSRSRARSHALVSAWLPFASSSIPPAEFTRASDSVKTVPHLVVKAAAEHNACREIPLCRPDSVPFGAASDDQLPIFCR
jgi:hypothetical protein